MKKLIAIVLLFSFITSCGITKKCNCPKVKTSNQLRPEQYA